MTQPLTMLSPDFPFSYDCYLAGPQGLGTLPAEKHGTEVAVIGAGAAGVVAAYELMKMGLRPVIYEAGSIGGRLKTESFDAAPDVVADLGGMRFPTSGRAFYHYVALLGLQTQEFPNPLSPAAPSTVIELKGESIRAETAADLPEFYTEVAEAWKRALREEAELDAVQRAIRERDASRLKDLWNQLVRKYDDQSFYAFLANSAAFRHLTYEHLETFGQVGFGTGGWDTDFTNSILEVLRVVFTDADDNHRSIVGGAQRLPVELWHHSPAHMAHWPAGTSLASLHGGAPRGAVTGIRRGQSPDLPSGGISVTEKWGRNQVFAAAVVTCQSWLLSSRIDTDEALFTPSMWRAIEKSHYMPLLQDLCDGRPALLAGHRPGDRPAEDVDDPHRPASPGHLPAGEPPSGARRTRPTGVDPALLHLERRCSEVAGPRRIRAHPPDAALPAQDLPGPGHRLPHHR
ncbi:hypothetical protein GCM10028800_03370 [Nesterenkonia populi]